MVSVNVCVEPEVLQGFTESRAVFRVDSCTAHIHIFQASRKVTHTFMSTVVVIHYRDLFPVTLKEIMVIIIDVVKSSGSRKLRDSYL